VRRPPGAAVVRLQPHAGEAPVPDRWPDRVPAVAALLTRGLDLAPGATVLVGENGTGKSTVVEALAEAFGLDPQGGSRHARQAPTDDRSGLGARVLVVRPPGGARGGFFLRAETMHAHASYLDEVGGSPSLHAMSHGESFLELLRTRFTGPGLYVLDEPEAALSFTGCLALVRVLHELVDGGAQVVVATHSPLVAALPGAALLQLDEDGIAPAAWEDLPMVQHWRAFLAGPARYLRPLLDQD
jgi:predicted ATPase